MVRKPKLSDVIEYLTDTMHDFGDIEIDLYSSTGEALSGLQLDFRSDQAQPPYVASGCEFI